MAAKFQGLFGLAIARVTKAPSHRENPYGFYQERPGQRPFAFRKVSE
jgi:hypothetical protein